MSKKPATLRRPVNIALLELQRLIDFLGVIDPGLTRDEVLALTGFIVHSLPELLTSNPEMLKHLKGLTQAIKDKRK